MRCGTSFFNGALFKKTLTRFWPLWAANLVLWGLMLPMQGLLYLNSGSVNAAVRFGMNQVASFTGGAVGVVVAVIGGALVAMAVCSHLYTQRSANFMGALPVRREGQFLSSYLAGLAMLVVPVVVVFLVTIPVELALGQLAIIHLLGWLAATCGLYFFFYSFAVCIGMFTGHILVLPVFYGVFNALAAVAYYLLNWILAAFYYGFGGMSQWVETVRDWLTPVVPLVQVYARCDNSSTYFFRGGSTLAIYCGVAVALTVCALLLYRRRRLELAGDVVAVRSLRPVFKYCVAFFGGACLGLLTAVMLGTRELGLMIAILVWGVVSYFVAQMLLDKSFRVFKKWKGGAVVAVAFLAAFLVIGMDLTGYESRVPKAGEVTSVAVSGLESYPSDSAQTFASMELTDPDQIAAVVALHGAVLAERDEDLDYCDRSCHFSVVYTLKNGTTIRREYRSVMLRAQDEAVNGTVTQLVSTLVNDRELVWRSYGFEGVERFIGEQGGALEFVWTEDGDYVGEDAQRLWAAVQADFQAGRIGVRTLFDDEFADGLRLEFSWSASVRVDGVPDTSYYSLSIRVQPTATETLRVLSEISPAGTSYVDTEIAG